MFCKTYPKIPYKKKTSRVWFLIFLLIVVLSTIFILYQFQNKVIPIAITITEKYAITKINSEINNSTEQLIKSLNISESDFFTENKNSKYMSVNTLLINDICSQLSVKISENLNNMPDQKVSLPIGALTGIDFFSNFGPKFNVALLPIGNTIIDYETEFESVGINQINFHIYLNITSEVTIVNPFYTKPLVVKRKLMLVNTVYSGEIPQTYLNIPQN